ncbi:LapA family giant adhesin [Pseudomonas sp. NPDC098740]|uniref:LapA family giant adhesin n=1 Tax=Pseudomonas sp. NPDC098740 TaxID=3364486 RepID=UPI00383A03A7
MSSVVAIVKSIVGQVFAVSPEGVRRILVEGDRLFVGDQVDTGAAGAVTLELADGRTLDLGRDTQWSGSDPDSSTDLAQATAQAAPSVEELQQAIVAGADPTTDLEATAAGPTAAGTGGAAGSGHSFVMLDATAGRVDPTIGFPTAGIGTAALAAQNTIGGQTADTSANVQRESTLTLSATPAITEAGGVLVYTATLSQAPLTDLTITLSNGSVIVIQAGQLIGTVNVPLAPNDTVYSDPTQINVSVTGTTGGSGIIVTPPTTPAVTQVTDTVDTTTVALTAGANVTEGGQITYTATLTNPAQTPVTITLSNGSIITIDAGNTTGSVNVPTPANDVYNNGSTVTTTITGATGGNFENLAPNPTPAVTTITDSPDATTVTLTAGSTVTEGGQITYTATLTNPAQTPVTVTLSNGSTITIEAGKTTGTVNVDTPANDVYQNGSTVSTTITGATGGNFENLVSSTAPAVTTITDSADNTGLSLTATGTVVEGGQITYTATLTNPAGTPMTVTLSNGSVITIEAGKTTGSVSVDTAANDVYNNGSTVSTTITETTGGNFEQLTPSIEPAQTTITDSKDNTGLSLTATGTVVEGGQITYTATLTNPAGTPVTVTLSNGAVITIAADATTGSVTVDTAANDVYNNGSTVSTTITGTTGGNFEQLTPSTEPALTTITDSKDETGLSLSASTEVAEGGQIVYTATLTNPAGTPVTVTLSNGAVITIAADATTGSVSVPAPADDVYKDAGKVEATIKDASGGNFENLVTNPAAAVTEVTDTINTSTVSLTANDTVAEGGTVVYTASVSAEVTGSPVVVTLSNGQTITIPVGASSASVNFTAPNDALAGGGSLSVKINDAKGGNYEKLEVDGKPANTAVTDSADTTTVSLSATESVAEGGSIVYTANLTHAAGTPVTVTLSNGAVITIAANATSGSVTVEAPKDDVYKDAGKVEATIKDASGGNFENLVTNPAAAVTEVTDTINTSTVSLTANDTVAEGGTVVYTASVSAEVTGSPVVVTLSNGQTITIPVGSSSASVNFVAPNDALAGGGSLSVKIDDAKGGNFEKLEVDGKPADTSVTDKADTTTISLSATDSVAEGGSIVYTANLTHAAGTPVTVTLSNGAVITIAADATSGSVTVAAPKDDAYIDAGKVSATITTATGGNFENLVKSPAAAVTTVTDTLDTSTVTLTASSSVAEGGTVVYTVSVGAPVTGSPVVVTLSNGQTITIGIGQSSGTVNAVVSNDVLSGHAPLTNSITKVSGGNYENLIADKTPVSTSVTDTVDTTTLSLSATGNVKEGGQITYTATLTHAAGTPVTVTLSNGATITIDAGKTTGTVKVDAPKDDVYKDAGKLEVTIKDAAGGNFENLVTSPTPAVTNVADTTNTTHLTLSAEKSVLEGSHITYTATLTNAAQTPVTVKLSNGETITIDAGKTSGSVTIAAPSDDVYKDAGKLTVTMTDASGGNFEKLDISKASVTTTVKDTVDTTSLSLSASHTVSEGGQITYTATLSNPTDTAMTVKLSNGAVINIAAGATTGSVNFAAPANTPYIDGGKVQATIASQSGGNFEKVVTDHSPAVTTVTDSADTTGLSLSATGSVAEGGSIVYTATLTNAAGTAMTVTLNNGAVIHIAKGATTGSVNFAAPKDDVYKDAGKVEASITKTAGGNFENLVADKTPAVTDVTDTLNTSTVSLTANSTVAEGGTVVYTASVNAPVTGSPVVVTLSNGQSITIPVGASSASVKFTAPNDALAGGGSLSVKIDGTTGGNYENLVANQTPAVTSVTDVKDTTTLSLSATDSVAEGGSIVYTATLTHAAGTPVTVNLSNGAVITIAANATSGSVTVKAPADDVYKDAGKVEATIKDASGGNFENLVTSPAAAVTEVTDTINTSTVSLTANGTVAEGGTVVYTASVSAEVTGSPVVVTLSNGQTITIPVGASSASVNFIAPNDALAGGGSLSVKIDDAKGGNYEKLEVNGKPADTSITDTADTTTVSLTATDSVAEGGSIVYTANLTHAAGTPVTVNLSNGAVITIAANATSGSVTVKAPADDVYKDAGKIEATIKDASGGNFENLVTSPAAAVTEVTDTIDTSTVSLTANGTVAEGGTVVYTASVTAPVTDSPVVVTLSNGQTITIPVGASSASVNFTAPNDALAGGGSLSVKIDDAKGGNYEKLEVGSKPANTSITDTTDTTTVSLSATESVAEGGSIVYTANLTHAAGTPVTVTLSNGAVITIAANATSGSVTVDAPKDDVYKDAGKVEATIKGASGGNFENLVTSPAAAVTEVTDTLNTSTISLKATPTAAEGGNVVYTASVTSKVTGKDVVVTLANGEKITIPVGESTASITVKAPNDALVGHEPLTNAIKDVTGGNYENLVADKTPTSTAISDTLDTTKVTMTASDQVLEGGNITYTANLTNAAGSDMTVKLSNGESIVIKAGDKSGSITVPAPADDVYKDGSKITVRIDSTSGGDFEKLDVNKTAHTTTVKDTIDATTLKLSADVGTVGEGGQINYTATLNHPADTAMTVTLSNGLVINIKAGESSGSASFTVPNNVYTGAADILASIKETTGGNFEQLDTDRSAIVTKVTDTADTTSLTLSASGSVQEGGQIVYTATLSQAAGSNMTVKLSNGATITILKDAVSGHVSVAAPKDDVYKDAGKIEATIKEASGGNFENLVTSPAAAVTDVTDTINTSTVSLTANSTVAEGGTVVYTASVTAPVTGSPVVVTLSNGQTITIPVGSSSASVNFIAPNDALAGGGSLSVKIDDAKGGNYEKLEVNGKSADTSITDTADTTTVSLSATESVAEGGSIVYTANLTHAAGTPVTVTLSNGAVITIAANATSGSVTVKAPADDVYKDAGKVEATIKDASGGNFENLVTSPAAAVTDVTDTINTSTVSLTANGTVAEGGTVVYTASVTAPVTDSPVVVTLSNGQTITIPVGSSSASVNFIAPNDALAGGGSLSVKIDDAKGGNFEKLEVNGKPADTAVSDTVDTTKVTMTASDYVVEGGTITYTVNLSNAAGTNMTVKLSNGESVVIKAGDKSGSITIPAPADDVYKDGSKITVGIASTDGGNFEKLDVSKTTHTTTVNDTTDTTTLKLSADVSTVGEGDQIVYTATLSHPADTAMTVTLNNGLVINIKAGESSGSAPYTVLNDIYTGATPVSAAIADSTGGNFEKLDTDRSAVVTKVTDTADTTTISLSATESVAEGGSIVYTANLTNAAGTPVTVTLSNGAVITIAANATSGSVTVKAPADDVYKDAGKVEATIKDATGGNFENLVTNPAAAVTEVTDTINTSTVSLTANGTVAEGGTVVYTASVTAPVTGSPVVVTLSNGQSITIPVGSSSGSVNFIAPNDALAGGGSLSVKIDDAKGGNYEKLEVNGKPADTSITDTADTTTVSLGATESVAEGGSIVYTANLTHAAGTPVTVTLSNGAVITIAANATSGSVTVDAPKDDVYIDAGKVSATITTATGGNFENLVPSTVPAVTEVTDTLNTSTVSLTANGTVAEGGTVVYTASVSAEVTGSPVVVTLSNGQTITIPVGSSSASVNFTAPNDALAGGGSLSVKIDDAKGGNYEKLEVNGKPADTSITDTADTTTVSLGATESVAEGGSIVYTASLTHAAGAPVTVTLSNGKVITIAANATSGSVTVDAPKDDAYIDAGKVSATITTATGGNFENLVPSTVPAVTEVTDTIDTSTVTLKATESAAEGGTVTYTATVGAPVTGSPVTVSLANGQTITIEVGKTTGTVTAIAPNDALTGHTPLTNSITNVSGGNYENLVADKTPVSTTVTDTADTTNLTLSASNSVAEGGSIVYTATLTHAAGTPVTVTLSNGKVITIAANATSGSVTVDAPKDDAYIDAGKVSATITTATGGNFENLVPSTAPAETNVTDTFNKTEVSITGSTSVTEGQTASYTVNLTNPAQTEVTLKIVYSGTAADGSDFTGVYTVQIPAGGSSASFNVATLDDRITEGTENFVVKIDSATGGNFENLAISASNGSVSTSIIDNDAPPVLDLDANNSSGATGANYNVTFTEGTTGQSVSIGDTDLKITDPDSTLLTGATIVLTNRQDGDALNLGNSVNGITINANSTNGTVTLTLSGNATLADYMQQIKNISFTNSSENPSSVPRIITVTVTDGSNYSNTATTTVNVVGVNDAPTAAPVNVTGTEDTPLILGWSTFGVSDVDSAAANLGVKITQLPGEGKLQFLATDGKTWTDVANNQTFTKADIDAGKLRFLPDTNESGSNGYNAGLGNKLADYAQIQFQPTDGSLLGNTGTIKIDITPVADAPSLSVADNSVKSTGLIKEVWTGLSGLGTDGSGASSGTLKSVIDGAGKPNSSGTVSNVQSDGSVAAGTASKTSGLIYLEAGKTYTFSGTGDDSLLVTIGGKNVAATTWGAGGKLSGSFTPTTSGYYTLDIYHHNQSGPGNYDVNLSVNGSAAVDLNSAGVPLYPGVADLAASGVTVSDLHGTSGEGYYEGYKLNEAAEGTSVHLSAIRTALTDTDGSESLSVKISGIPAGSVLTDGAGHTFTASATSGEANVTGWNLGSLTVTPPPYYNGQFNLTVTSTSTESLGGSAQSNATIPVTVYPAVYNAATATAADDTISGTDGNDIMVADIGGLTVVPGTNYNIAFMVDSSGSMSPSSVSSAKDSLTSVFNTLKQSMGGNSGTVNIFLADFDNQVNKSVSVNLNDPNALILLKAVLDSMASGGGTNYEDVFKTTANWFQSADAVANKGATNLTYFITDGKPTYYQNDESTNPNLYGGAKLDSVITTSNYQLGKAITLYPDSNHQIDITASGNVTVWTKSGGSWSDKDFGTLHAQGDGTYEFSSRDGNGSSTGSNAIDNSTDSFALLSKVSTVEAIGINKDVTLADLKPYDSDKTPQTNIDPKDLANSIIGHTEATMPGADTVNGGDGNDILFGDLVSFNGVAGEGYQAMQAFVAKETGVDVSKVTTSNVHQFITEHYTVFDVSGAHDGNDSLLGGAGNDILFGQGGNDLLDAGKGNDILLGGSGNDSLMGGQGNDILIGGSGADTFVWKAGDTGSDVIKDFKASEGDRIDLRDLLQGETGSTIDNFLKITTVDGVSSLQVSSAGKFNGADAAAAQPDVTIKLEGNNWSSASINSLIAGSDPTIKIDHNNS